MAIAKKPSGVSKPTERIAEKAIEAFIAGGATKAVEVSDEEEGKRKQTTLRFDPDLLKRIDQAAKRIHVSRNAWLHVKLTELLDAEEESKELKANGRRGQ